MQIGQVTILLVASLSLGACATMAQEEARSQVVAQYASTGMRFVEQSATAREGLVMSTGGVTGVCVGPDDPRWEQAAADDE